MNKICPVCNHKEFKSALQCIDHYVSGENFEIIECTQCGMKITNDFPPENTIGKYYETEDYISHSNTKKGLVNSLYHHVRQRMLKKKAGWVESASGIEMGKILDVGAGTGYFAGAMKKRGWEVSIVEQSDEARKFAENNFNLHGFSSIKNFIKNQHSNGEKSQDVISLWHVLEHLEPLNESMAQFYKLLNPGGTLIIAVPNCSSYDAKIYKNLWAAYDVPRHLWHFTSRQMEILTKKHGFSLVETKKMPFDAFYISMMSEKYARNPLPFVNGFWTGLCGFFFSIFDKNNSSSLVYILRKEEKA